MFQHALYLKFMASALQQEVTNVQLRHYTARTPVNQYTLCRLISLSFLVAIITAVIYDYSKWSRLYTFLHV